MELSERMKQFWGLLEKRYLFCVDLEATCCDKGSFPREEMEIIEFGGVLLDKEKNWEAVDRVEFFIQPTIHPVLTEFCKKLTNITQEQVDNGLLYEQAYSLTGRYQLDRANQMSWCSWGEFDKNIMIQGRELHDLPPLLNPGKHFNLKVWYSRLNMTKKGFGLDKAVNREGLTFLGQHHRALSDAENVAQIFRKLVLG